MKTMLVGGFRLHASCAAAALAVTLGYASPAEAFRCRPGLMYRVSKGICVSRASNEQFLGRRHGGSNGARDDAGDVEQAQVRAHPHRRPHGSTEAARLPPERPPALDEPPSQAAPESYAAPEAKAPPAPAERQARSPSPFGTLALPSLRCGVHADTICTPADLFKVE